MIRLAIALTLTGAAASAASFDLPAGCSGLVTVQSQDCTVTHYFRCEGDAPGDTHRIDIEETGPVFETQTDAEARWLESHNIADGVTDRIGAERDPASLSALIETGRDDFDFLTYSSDGAVQRYTGYDRLTGETLEIDGITLLRTEFEMRVEDQQGNWIWSSRGHEYVVPDWYSFLSGERTITAPGEEFTRDGSPRSFAFPGESGFLARRPIFGCGVMMSHKATAEPRSAPLVRG